MIHRDTRTNRKLLPPVNLDKDKYNDKHTYTRTNAKIGLQSILTAVMQLKVSFKIPMQWKPSSARAKLGSRPENSYPATSNCGRGGGSRLEDERRRSNARRR